jgi:hypothetical protein
MLANFWTRPSVDNGLEIVLDPLLHSKPGEPERKQAVSICHGVWLRPFCTYPAWAWSECAGARTVHSSDCADLDRVAVFSVISRLGIVAASEPPSP